MRNTCILRMRHFMALPLLLILMAIGMLSQGQTVTVTTDQDDYIPGEWVIITGSGWQNDSTVQLTLTHLDPLPDPLHAHESWNVQPSEEGYIYYEWFVEEQELNTSFDLTALGISTGLTATTYFTDAGNASNGDGTMAVSPTSACVGSTGNNFTFTFTGRNSKDFPNGSQLTLLIPNLWTTPTTSNVSVISGTATASLSSISGNKITVNFTAIGASSFTITYNNVTAPTNASYTFITQTKVTGTFSNINTQPSVTVNPLPIPSIIETDASGIANNDGIICNGSSATLTASGGTSYLWSNGATTAAITVSPTTTTTYTVTVTNAGGCSANTTSTVTVNPLPTTPTISASGPTTFCSGGSVTLTSSAGNGYLWSTGATSQAITVTTAGNYTVQVANANGCLSASSAATSVTVNPLPSTPTISAGGPTTFCTGGSVTLTSSLGSSYLWSTEETTRSITVTASGNYSVRVTNASGCQSNVSAITAVTVNPIPSKPTITANGETTTVCDGGAVVLSSSASSGNQWYRNGSVLPGAVNQTYSATMGGDYTVVVTANGCPSPSSEAINVTVNARPTGLLSGTQTICNGNSATLSIAVSGTGPWSGTLTGGIPFSGSSSPITVNVSPAATTTYSLASLADANCTAVAGDLSGTAEVTLRPIPTAAITVTGNSTICSGSTTTIKISGPANGTVVYTIDGGSDITGSINNGGNLNLTTANLTSNTTYNLVSVAYGDAPNCSNPVSGSVMITVNQPPVITTQPENQTITYGGSTSFTVASTGIPAPGYQWQVNTGMGFTNIAGATSSTLAVENPAVAMNGTKYRVIANNICATVISQEVTLTVNARPITITADAKSKIYGNDDPALTYQITSGTLAYTDGFTGTLTRDAGENVGAYAIKQGTVALNSNYALSYVGADLTVTKRAITITADAKTKTYGDADPTLTAQATNVVNGDQPTGTLSRAAGENVGSYAISKDTYTYGSNYAESFVEGINLLIGQRAITIKAEAKSKTYGNADPALTAQATNVVNGDKPSGNLSRVAGENVGSYLISKDSYTYGSNYAETYEGANLVIGQRPITITADAKSKTYGNADPELTAKATNVVEGDNPTGALSRAAGENVGSYLISKSTYTYGSNYAETFEAANLIIGQRPITIKADAQSKTYGDPDPELTAQATNTVNNDKPTGALSRAAGENVGSYVISQSTYTYGSNYAETFEAANLVIGQREITITADAQSKTYGEADPELTAQATNVVDGDNPTGALSRAAGENVGSYVISKSTYTYGSNYAESFVEANLVIGQREITITADAQSKTYGDPDPELTAKATNVVEGDNPTGALSRAAGENVGSYLISKSTYTYGSNYSESFVEANLVIGQRPITIKADAQSKTYGDPDPELTAKATNVVEGDNPTGALLRAEGENVGSYLISKSTYTYGSNYAESFVEANLVIGQRPITIKADAQSKTYGDPDPELTAKATNVVEGDNPTGALSRAAGENVGSYVISKSTYTYGSNYAESFVEANLVIGQRPITIKADAQSKTYGEADPELTAKATNVVEGDKPSGSLLRATGENVGSYLISKSTYTYGSNYAESFVEANLVIGQRPITITADAQSKTYGEADPELTAKATNVVVGDNPTGALLRAEGENVGSYLISKSTYTYGSNYAETFIGANLVIGQRSITITADAKTKTYGDADPVLTAQATNTVAGDAPSGSLSRATGENVGSYLISKATYTYGSNYAEKFVEANLVIGQRSITITADAKSKTYGDADPALTAQVTVGSIVGTDAHSGSLSRATGENVGSYLISKSTYTYGSNYEEKFVGANLVIGQRSIAIAADDNQSKYIGQDDPKTFTYHITSGSLAFIDAFSGSLSRDAGECAGTYLINQGNLALSTNYALSYNGTNFTINGVTVDASQSSFPVPTGTAATLIAKVLPAVQGVKISFTLDNGTTATFPCYESITDVDGIAKCTLPVMPVEVYKIIANVGVKSSSYCVSSTAAYLAVYDPNGGFVTGGGWINSPAGSYTANASLTGKANFGFNSKYEKGKTTPTGNTEFQFQAGNLNFSSSTYGQGSLVISGAKATYKGVGTINGRGSYPFMVSVVDGNVTGGGGTDKFRIKIWDGNNVIYDNNMDKDENELATTALGGGSIVIHSNVNGNKDAQITTDASPVEFVPTLKVYPNPFTDRLNIEFSYATDTRGKLEIYSVTGAKLQTLYDGPVTGGQLYNFEYLPRMVSSQVVFYHLTLDGKTQVGKVLFNERQ